MGQLKDKNCIPCQGGVPALAESEKVRLKEQIHSDWQLRESGTRLFRTLGTKDFAQAMELAVKVGKLAEEQWHHPEITVGFGHVDIEIWTHKINDLVESDFIFCAKCDEILQNLS